MNLNFFKMKNLSSTKVENGFSLVETLISVACLGMTILAYAEFSKNTRQLNKKTLEQMDLMALRMFLTQQFSCEKTLAYQSTLKSASKHGWSCAASQTGNIPVTGGVIRSLTSDGRELIKRWGANIGGFRIHSLCDIDGTVQNEGSEELVPSIRFFAAAPSNPKAMGHNAIQAVDNEWIDVMSGNELRCRAPTDPGPPIGNLCIAKLESAQGGLTSEIYGKYFRNRGWGGGVLNLVLDTQYTGRAKTAYGKPTQWKMHFVNKNMPLTQSADFVIDASGSQTVPTPVPEDCKPPTAANPKPLTGSAPVTSVTPACAVWQQKIPFERLSRPSNWFAAPIDLIIKGLNQAGEEMASCSLGFYLIDPLILTWPIRPSEPDQPDVYTRLTSFDLRGMGTKRRTGWLGGRAAFLTLDLNDNSQIDHGGELFGEMTNVSEGSQELPKNGFEALARHDNNHDNRIDSHDKVFTKLRLWFDENGDGESQSWEILRLKDLDVQSIELNFSPVKTQPKRANALAQFLYEARFHGPEECGPNGCRIYDVILSEDRGLDRSPSMVTKDQKD